MRTARTVIVGGIAALALGVTAAPAMAADQDISFTVASGTLTITAPSPVTLGIIGKGVSYTTPVGPTNGLGTIAVTDDRGAPDQGTAWTATVSSPAPGFTTTGTGSAITSVTYTIPGACTGTGTLTCTPTAGAAAGFVLTTSPQSQVTGSGGTAPSTGSWQPTLTFTIPTNATSGDTYTGTVTHSVS